MKRLSALALLGLCTLGLQGCLAGMAVSAAGDVAEGAVNATVFTAKTTGRAAGAVIPGGDEDDDEDRKKR